MEFVTQQDSLTRSSQDNVSLKALSAEVIRSLALRIEGALPFYVTYLNQTLLHKLGSPYASNPAEINETKEECKYTNFFEDEGQ